MMLSRSSAFSSRNLARCAVMSAGSFGMLVFLSHKGFECENLDDLKGLNRRNPWYAFIMLLLMFSMAGIPPLAGFFGNGEISHNRLYGYTGVLTLFV